VYCLPVEVEEDENDQNQELIDAIAMIKKTVQRNDQESKQKLQAIEDRLLNLEASNQALLVSLQNGLSQLQKGFTPPPPQR